MGALRFGGQTVECALAAGDRRGYCSWCGEELPKGKRRWCSTECSRAYAINHFWTDARAAALKRDGYRCRWCGRHQAEYLAIEYLMGWLYGHRIVYWMHKPQRWSQYQQVSVNHVFPRNGRGYGPGCHHHQEDLETVCMPCHVHITKVQRRLLRAMKYEEIDWSKLRSRGLPERTPELFDASR